MDRLINEIHENVFQYIVLLCLFIHMVAIVSIIFIENTWKTENILPKCQKLNTTICKQTHYMMNVFQETSRVVRIYYVQSL